MTKLQYHSLASAEQSFAMLDLIPDTHAWIKDTAGVFVCANRLFYERFGFRSMHALRGKSDEDLAPHPLAEKYRDDDARVLTGNVINDRLELIASDSHAGDWFLTSKWPVYDFAGSILGTFGISRHLNETGRTTIPLQELQAPIDYINAHYASDISVASLANACNVSVSALERRFRKHLNKTPHQYINERRLERARQLLVKDDKPIGIIALETGFADHSHFTRSFRRGFGMTPRQARRALSFTDKTLGR